MSASLDRPEIRSEVPPLAVVRACERLGFQPSLNVHWCRMSCFLGERSHTSVTQGGLAGIGTERPERMACPCGEPVPDLDQYAITFVFEKVADYLLGQCRRCGTIFWEEG